MRDRGTAKFFHGRVKELSAFKELVEFTSQKCSCCGHTEKRNRLSQSRFVCQQCGFEENADVNAAKNILACGISSNQKTDCGVFVSPLICENVGQNAVKRQKDIFGYGSI